MTVSPWWCLPRKSMVTVSLGGTKCSTGWSFRKFFKITVGLLGTKCCHIKEICLKTVIKCTPAEPSVENKSVPLDFLVVLGPKVFIGPSFTNLVPLSKCYKIFPRGDSEFAYYVIPTLYFLFWTPPLNNVRY